MTITTTTEDFQTRVNRERDEKRAAYKALYLGVASHLDRTWALTQGEESYDGDELYRLTNGEMRLHLRIDFGKKRVSCSGSWPKQADSTMWHSPRDVNESGPEISVAIDRGPEAIAKEIKRRFLPEYERIFALLVDKRVDALAYANNKRAAWQRLVEAAGDTLNHVRDRGGDPSASVRGLVGGGYGDVRLSSPDSVTIELRGISTEQAILVLQALHQEGK